MSDGEDNFVPRAGSGGLNNASFAAATSASREKADAYLDKHAALIDLQMQQVRLQNENLRQQDEYELSHLRWRRFNDQMAGAAQIMLVGLGLLVVAVVAAAIWNASQADGLVVDSFSVPPSLAASGLNGDVVANDFTQRLAAIRDFANANSLAYSKDVRQDRDRDIKVEIPQTGISLTEAWRYLRLWLGNERRLSGHLRSLADGQIALNVSLDRGDSFTFTGKPADLDKLENQAAEHMFATVDPVNIVLYFNGKGRNAETMQAAAHLIALGGSNRELAEAYSLHADMDHHINGNAANAVAESRLAISLDPKSTPPHMELLEVSRDLGHNEIVLQEARLIASLRQEDNVGDWRTGNGVPWVWQLGAFYRAAETGDFADVYEQPCKVFCSQSDTALRRADAAARLHDPELAKVLITQALTAGAASNAGPLTAGALDGVALARIQYYIDASVDHWDAAANDARRLSDAVMADESLGVPARTLQALTRALPLLADALAQSGDLRNARGTIETTPLDCYDCIRERGKIDALDNDSRQAGFWFARAIHEAPSIPFAYADWGAMLLRAGQYDNAIAKFKQANEKGPHFADPLEMWGEALMLKNRSDLALAKFDEADKYAPNWSRLHLKWGEALFYIGRNDEARAQYKIAQALDLSAADKARLAKDLR